MDNVVQMKIFIGIPAFNEEKNIASIILKIKEKFPNIIVCNDGSSDQTGKIAEKMGAIVINHQKNMGYGAAIKSLFLKAKEIDSDILVTFDGDGQHNISEIKDDVKFHKVDISNYDELDEVIDSADGIFHEAALASVPQSFKEPERYHEVNAIGSENIFKLAKKHNAKVVFASTSGVSPETIFRAKPSAIAVFPTPGSPTKSGLFFRLLHSTWMLRSTSWSLPIKGSISPVSAF